MWTLQVFVLCYYSDMLIESSSEISNAVYRSKWYKANSVVMKDLLFVLRRSQKPCKLTALGFTDLNLRVFCKIMSSAWSYFALLHTVYNK
ncbi:putative odorant receptor 92a [Ostrinia furnacalis]|uniref:putative odorant receptor 92a n=1 Tax=Ostrinia furnacalis TaxID=93504 RepID=UPI00103DC5F2|nr:putative odorant receptor 92a [Ostrinia furnacalis]